MTLHSAAAPSESSETCAQPLILPRRAWLAKWDALAALTPESKLPKWANRILVLGLMLFAVAVPHSIFAAHFSLDLSLLAWIVRDVTMRKLHFRRTPVDLPLACFAGLTVLSACFSVEPTVSLPKLKTLLLFGALYLFVTNLRPAATRALLTVLLASSLAGVGFSLLDKVYGRGMEIISLAPDCPLRVEQPPNSTLLPGDAVWMIGKQRVYTLERAATLIRRQPVGTRLSIEALRAGDPLPVSLIVTKEIKANPNPLGINVAGRTRRFRVSGFTRQFLTYAEQMQMLALVSFGLLLTSFAWGKNRESQQNAPTDKQLWYGLLFGLFALALVFTASRAVIAAFLLAVSLVAGCVTLIGGNRRVLPAALLLVVVLGGFSIAVIRVARETRTTTFNDDSTVRRLAYMKAGLRLIPRHPWLGVGMDSHKLHWQEWGFPGEYVTHTHSTPIQLALDRGLPALGCYIWLMATLLGIAWRGYRAQLARQNRFSAGLQLGAFGAYLGFSASSLTNYNFGDSEALFLLLLLTSLVLLLNQTTLAQSTQTTSPA